jgi:hypothetical protein
MAEISAQRGDQNNSGFSIKKRGSMAFNQDINMFGSAMSKTSGKNSLLHPSIGQQHMKAL